MQIAKALGAEVTGVASASTADLLHSLGADHVINYETNYLDESSRQYDLIIDIGGRSNKACRLRNILKTRGTLVFVGGEGGNRFIDGIGRQIGASLLSIFLQQRMTMFIASENYTRKVLVYKTISFLQRISNGKVVLALFVVTNLVYGAILGYSIPLVLSFAPDSILFDMSPSGYSYGQAVQLLESLGQEGRNLYLMVQLPLDFIYPGLFAISYALMLTWLFKKLVTHNSKLFLLIFIPVLAGLFDYMENLSIIAMLNNFPDVSEGLVRIASVFTIAKS